MKKLINDSPTLSYYKKSKKIIQFFCSKRADSMIQWGSHRVRNMVLLRNRSSWVPPHSGTIWMHRKHKLSVGREQKRHGCYLREELFFYIVEATLLSKVICNDFCWKNEWGQLEGVGYLARLYFLWQSWTFQWFLNCIHYPSNPTPYFSPKSAPSCSDLSFYLRLFPITLMRLHPQKSIRIS